MNNHSCLPLLQIAVLSLNMFYPINVFGQKINSQVLWKQGTGKYNNYRIPSVIVTQKGTILAFCEGREAGDTGDIDLLLKRSEDNGKTWSTEQVVWDDGANTCGNPCPVVDAQTGRICLFLTWNNGNDAQIEIMSRNSVDTRMPYVCYSDDDGLNWSEPQKMPGLKDPSWTWYATGPGIGIQVIKGKYKGRLVIPSNHSYDDPKRNIRNGPYGYGSHVLYSDDQGKTWGKSQSIIPGCNESQITELGDETLVMNMRSYNDKYCRANSNSRDGGATWSEISHDLQLVESKCQASLLNFGDYKKRGMYLFSNPSVPVGRTAMTIKASFDNCKSWSNGKLVHAGPSAYSCLVKLNNRQIGILFECGEERPYENLMFISFPVDGLFQPGELLLKN